MMTLAGWLVAMVGPLMARLLTSLGVSLVVLTGATVAVATLKTSLLTALGTAPLAGLQLLGLFGFWTALGMVFGTWAFLLTWKGTTGFIGLAKS